MIKHTPHLPSRYTFKASAGAGGYGTAYRCFDENLERDVIVKSITRQGDYLKLIDEIHALQKVKSKNVVQIYDVIRDEDGDPSALVEEYLPSHDLSSYCANPDDQISFLKVLYQIISGICDMHSCGVVHRDIKPHNIKFDAEGLIKIFDFNLSKHRTLPGKTCGYGGTKGFMAPELFPPAGIIDKPVDCYSFGAMVHYLTHKETPECTLHDPPVSPSPVDSIKNFYSFKDRLAEVFDKCLCFDPAERPSADSIKAEIARELLCNRHKALVTLQAKQEEISEHRRRLVIKTRTTKLVILYDGYDFVASEVVGDVYVNQNRLNPGGIISGSSVIIFGSPDLLWNRIFISFDVSHPEVLI